MASIGVYDTERKAKQKIIIEVELSMSPLTEPKRDSIEDTLDYNQIRETILAVVGEQHYDLQETLVRRSFDHLQQLDGVCSVLVRSAKPQAYDDCEAICYQLSNL